MKLSELIDALRNASEKSANIARIIRSEDKLLELLVQEKSEEQKNKRFAEDFKTLADVLVQETIKHDLIKQFPELCDNIRGEETNKFTNTLGETVHITIQSTVEETSQLLCKVLDGDENAARLLAETAHHNVSLDADSGISSLSLDLNSSDVGIWIDPLDSTAQYIQGTIGERNEHMFFEQGLQCVTVLTGAFNIKTGLPIVGVINYPFWSYNKTENRWNGRILWGVCCDDVCINNIEDHNSNSQRAIVTSVTESEDIKTKIKKDFNLFHPSGAGHKILTVAEGFAGAYILTKDSVFKWDSCGPHAILRSLGGGIISYTRFLDIFSKDKTIEDFIIDDFQLRYHEPDDIEKVGVDKWCNLGGILAYTNIENALDIIKTITLESS